MQGMQAVQRFLVAGVDEAGRGPLAGPVTAAAVILPPRFEHSEITDSKKLSEKKRERLSLEIMASAISYAVASASEREIEQLNIRVASRVAMERAASAVQAEMKGCGLCFLVDGNMTLSREFSSEATVKGDSKILAIGAASILAKVARDTVMKELDAQYPVYGFAGHKGYPTKSHRAAIEREGPCPVHRKTFSGVSQFLTKLK